MNKLCFMLRCKRAFRNVCHYVYAMPLPSFVEAVAIALSLFFSLSLMNEQGGKAIIIELSVRVLCLNLLKQELRGVIIVVYPLSVINIDVMIVIAWSDSKRSINFN